MNTAPAAIRLPSVTIFAISLMAICSELCFSLMLGLKCYSHMVYVVISFALLGYGVGSNLCLLLSRRWAGVDPNVIAASCLVFVALFTVLSAWTLPMTPVRLDMIYSWQGLISIAHVYAAVAMPFVGIGYLIGFLFAANPADSRRLYFWDLVGAGLGAAVFFPLLPNLGPLRVLLVLAAGTLILAVAVLGISTAARKGAAAGLVVLVLLDLGSLAAKEPRYEVDPGIGWEYIPGKFTEGRFRETWRVWHPLGRTDLHEMTDPAARDVLSEVATGTFEICVDPPPEFSYFTNSYRAGTPVFRLAPEYLKQAGCRIRPFSQPMEVPYVLLDKPRVMVIGAGGGRDIFMAKVHDAPRVVAAEINPATYQAMSPGGVVHEYSGRIYAREGVEVHNIDGRHLVKNSPSGSQDLVILNGIDTFAALSSGAYAFAENYLYTREAVQDYLRILSETGILNFNRWYDEFGVPRESLRLFIMILDALRSNGVERPWDHVVVGHEHGWGIFLVKRTPFTPAQLDRVSDYFEKTKTAFAYRPLSGGATDPGNVFRYYVNAFRERREEEFVEGSATDISVVRDDSPFFYKSYRFTMRDTQGKFHSAGGATAFHVQVVIVIQSAVFILIFIFLPLALFRRTADSTPLGSARLPFIVYFAALGIGFIFIEITLMQRFTLALGSPIYSVSVTLATLLVATGIGSLLSERIRRRAGSELRMIAFMSAGVVAYLLIAVGSGTWVLNLIASAPFPLRVAASVALLTPLGVCLGIFFPSGLQHVGQRAPGATIWAWGINSGFTVLGSTLSIVVAQFLGFNLLLLLAAACYAIAPLAYRLLDGRSPKPV